MSDQQQAQEERVVERIATPEETAEGIIPFVHGLGGDVVVTAYAANGESIGYLMANPISDDEVEVAALSGTVTRLVAVPRPPEEDEGDARP